MIVRLVRSVSRLAGVLLLASSAAAQTAPVASGTGSQDSAWNAMQGEKVEALALRGDVENGKAVYAVCSACHLPSGAGRSDGSFPQLAGQHATVLIKQIADIRAGRRDNPIMVPFATTLVDPQELADVAAYLRALPIPSGNGRGPGTNLARGEQLFQRDCMPCHGKQGEGDARTFAPMLAGQHYAYLLRQIRDIAAGRRRNANPDMAKLVQVYKDDELQAVVDYASRLPGPDRSATPGSD